MYEEYIYNLHFMKLYCIFCTNDIIILLEMCLVVHVSTNKRDILIAGISGDYPKNRMSQQMM